MTRGTCIFCGHTTSSSSSSNIQLPVSVLSKWNADCANSLCKLLCLTEEDPVPWIEIFSQRSHCDKCLRIIRDVNFSFRQLEALEIRLRGLKTKVESALVKQFGNRLDDSKDNKQFLGLGSNGGTSNEPSVFHKNRFHILQAILDQDLNNEKDEGIAELVVIKLENQDESNQETDLAPVVPMHDEDYKINNDDDDANYSPNDSCDSAYNDDYDFKPPSPKQKRRRKCTSAARPGFSPKPIPTQCEACNENFSCRTKWLIHVKKFHPEIKPYACILCPAAFRNHTSLDFHKKTAHPKTYIYSCGFCGKGFDIEKEFQDHEKHHKDSVTPFVCTFCDKVFSNSVDLSLHVKELHENDRKYVCTECSKVLVTKRQLTNHMRFHRQTQKCDICGGIVKSRFERHRRLCQEKKGPDTLEERRKFRCEVCGAGFVGNYELGRHLLIHSGAKDFKCSVCGKCFRLKSLLKKHEEIHSGIKSYFCEICGKGFGVRQNYLQHLNNHKNGPRNRKNGTAKPELDEYSAE